MTEHGGLRTTQLPPEAASVPQARRFTDQVLDEMGSTVETRDAARLLVSELTTNAVVHAHTPLRLTVFRYDHLVRVEVGDENPLLPTEPDCPDPMAASGRGLFLVAAMAKSWGVEGDERGKTIWFELADQLPVAG